MGRYVRSFDKEGKYQWHEEKDAPKAAEKPVEAPKVPQPVEEARPAKSEHSPLFK